MKKLVLLITSLLFAYIGTSQKSAQSQKIIDQAIAAHGGDLYDQAAYTFQFRDHIYTYNRDGGDYRYEKYHPSKQVKDVLDNRGFARYIRDEKQSLSTKEIAKYAESTNSVHYFAFLPYFLNDPAVNHRWIGEANIKGETYDKIEVSFQEVGGGTDFEDIYVYWIHKANHTVDYLAYSFKVNGGGVRFRSYYNRRNVEGIIFQDYINHKHDKTTPVQSLDKLFDQGELTELSRIELKDIKKLKS